MTTSSVTSPAILSTSVVEISGRSFRIDQFRTRFGEVCWMVFDLEALDEANLPEWVGIEDQAAAAVRRAANLAGL
jgi:hypothetical protein